MYALYDELELLFTKLKRIVESYKLNMNKLFEENQKLKEENQKLKEENKK